MIVVQAKPGKAYIKAAAKKQRRSSRFMVGPSSGGLAVRLSLV
jgi:hypothetical protein